MRFIDGPGTAGRLREALDRAGYTVDGLSERLGPHAFVHLAGHEPAPLVRATRAGDHLDVLARLFVLGMPVAGAAAAAALAPADVGALVAGGLLARDGDDVAGRVGLRPLDGPQRWVVAHDLAPPTGSSPPVDHVLGVSASTMALAGATIRRAVGAALDVGTGGGVQALYASAHAERVVATDLNPRAAALCRLTMALNDAPTVEVREGDMLAPVAGESFDLIVSNPPFVISPARRYLFRDAPVPVDEVCRDLVRAAPAHLAPGGHCQLLGAWAHVAGEDWRDRLAGWGAGSGCDVLVLQREVLDPAAHAASWLRQTEPPAAWAPEYDEWLDHYQRQGIEAVGLGLISLRRRDGGEGWFRAEEAPQDFAMPCGDHLGAAFELADFVAAHPGDRLLDVALAVAPDVVLDERARPAAGDGWAVTDRRLRQTAGLCREGEVDAALAAVVAGCDGTRPLGAVIAGAAAAARTDPAGLARAARPVVARLVEQGFLLPAGG